MRNKIMKQILSDIKLNHLPSFEKEYQIALQRGMKLLPTLTSDHVITFNSHIINYLKRQPRLTYPVQKKLTIMPRQVGYYEGRTFRVEYPRFNGSGPAAIRTSTCKVEFLRHDNRPQRRESYDRFKVTIGTIVTEEFRDENMFCVIPN